MRIFVSSTFEDLREHRSAAIRVLRQLGHEVLAMEDLVAASAAPLVKVIEMIDRSDAYVGIFAWRYGYVPGRDSSPAPQTHAPPVKDAKWGETSITHYEYLRALERQLPVMAFLLDERCAWPPQLIDGFDTTNPEAPKNADRIRALRLELQQQKIVSWFTTPADLEARVSAAVTMAGVTSQLNLQAATALAPNSGTGDSDSSGGMSIAIIDAVANQQHALKIDLAYVWWSSRLYLIAALAERLTQVRRILIVKGSPPPEEFIGQISTATIQSIIGPKLPVLDNFRAALRARPVILDDVNQEISQVMVEWQQAFAAVPEGSAKVDLTPELLRRWFGEAMLQQPVHITDLERASVVDLLRLLDYPNDYVPVITRRASAVAGLPASEQVDVLDKNALNARLARSYLVELMDRARII
jgi:uncharacterized protein DUF4062